MAYILKGSIGKLALLSADSLVQRMVDIDPEHSPQEQTSWHESLFRLIQNVHQAGLDNLWLIAEYSLIGDQRIDAIICGLDANEKPKLMLVESKQWNGIGANTEHKETEVKMNFADEYRTHPVVQVLQYKHQLEDNHSEVKKQGIAIDAIVFMDNFKPSEKNKLFEGDYASLIGQKDKVFVAGDEARLQAYLQTSFGAQSGQSVADQFAQGYYELGQADFSGIRKILAGKDNAVMIDDQIGASLAFDRMCKDFVQHPHNMAMIVKGSAGTGKTIVGLHLLYVASKRYGIPLEKMVFTFAKSRTLHEVLQTEMNIGSSDTGHWLPYLDEIRAGRYQLVVVDEAHRISEPQRTIKGLFETDLTQTDKQTIVVFLQDDHQRVRADEKGTVANLTQALADVGVTPTQVELTTQKRSQYQGNFVAQLRHMFFDEPETSSSKSEVLPLTVSDSLQEIDQQLQQIKAKTKANVKWFAPFNWDWISRNDPSKKDIVITDHDGSVFTKQWNPQDNQYKWYKGQMDDAFDQVGSIYTAQGLDYDYTGFIWSNSLVWDSSSNQWKFYPSRAKDFGFSKGLREHPELSENDVLEIVKNQFYVLLSRARRGTYIWFQDEPTKEHVLSFFGDKVNKGEN